MHDRIAAELATLKARRDERLRQAEQELSYLNGAIAVLEALLAPEPAEEPAKQPDAPDAAPAEA